MSTRSRLTCVAILIIGCLVLASPAPAADARLPLSNLQPAKQVPDLCLLKYRVSTSSPECQVFFDQGLAFFYSYTWIEAARAFETAAKHDPECAMAWWGLSRALDKWSKNNGNQALEKAKEHMAKASDREQKLITARLQEKGLLGTIADDQRKKTAAKTIDELLVLYDDDEEAWFYRAQLADSGTAAVPYYKALLRYNPLHPGANHELVHFYENSRRPALGWIHAENYIRSSPGMPHAFHMQAHLATRLGRWDKTSDRSARAIELQRALHKLHNVKPNEDWQYSHHLEILTISLIHDGRLREARAVRDEVEKLGPSFKHWIPWFKLHLAERDWDAAEKVIQHFRKADKATASYLAALMYLKQRNPDRATAEVEVLREAFQKAKNNKQLEFRLQETQGMLLCVNGAPDEGLKLLFKNILKSKDDYSHHAWGNGAYYMEAWGVAALQCGKDEIAEEAFLEALAHDPGSYRAALGMQVLCTRLGRTDEATRFGELAQKCWRKADPQAIEVVKEELNFRTTPTPKEPAETPLEK